MICNFISSELETNVRCTSWPNASASYACTDVGSSWKALDTSMSISQTKSCEQLCQQQLDYGCCYLGVTTGCYWKVGSIASSNNTDGAVGTSVRCSLKGTVHTIQCSNISELKC